MAQKSNYYDIKPLLKLNADYNIIMGERSNGKTYSVLKIMIEHFLKTGEFGVYLRRYADEIIAANMKTLFNPFDIEKLSKGKYNRISYRGKQFDIGMYDNEKDKWISKEPLCYCAALNTWENAKGADRGVAGVILFDEFLTRRFYLTNEFTSFQNVLSSFMRDRGNAKVFLVGNTVSFYSPYFEEFGLDNVKDMKVGDIACYTFENGAKIAIEYCTSVGSVKDSAKFFNFNSSKANMITTGKWDIPNYPHYTKSIDFIREVIFRFYILFDNEVICCCIVQKKQEVFLYFHQQTKDVDIDNELIFNCTPDGNPHHFTSFKSSAMYYGKVSQLLNSLISSNKMFFSTNKVGEIFNNYYKWQSRYSIIS